MRPVQIMIDRLIDQWDNDGNKEEQIGIQRLNLSRSMHKDISHTLQYREYVKVVCNGFIEFAT